MTTPNEILGAVYRKDHATLRRLSPVEANTVDEDQRTPLMHAILASDADPSTVRLLIERGAAVNAVDGVQKWTPLHFAARDGNEEIVEVLLNAGASVDAVNISGNTPLWENIMAPTREPKTIQTLLRHGADAWKKNKRGDAPIDVARHMGRNDLVGMLEQSTRPADPS
jgi:ankyrin repeat protein